MEPGRAMRTTPTKETAPASCSARVNGSWISIEQAQQAAIGARKVMTVASASGRYWSESDEQAVNQGASLLMAGNGSGLQYIPKTRSY